MPRYHQDAKWRAGRRASFPSILPTFEQGSGEASAVYSKLHQQASTRMARKAGLMAHHRCVYSSAVAASATSGRITLGGGEVPGDGPKKPLVTLFVVTGGPR